MAATDPAGLAGGARPLAAADSFGHLPGRIVSAGDRSATAGGRGGLLPRGLPVDPQPGLLLPSLDAPEPADGPQPEHPCDQHQPGIRGTGSHQHPLQGARSARPHRLGAGRSAAPAGGHHSGLHLPHGLLRRQGAGIPASAEGAALSLASRNPGGAGALGPDPGRDRGRTAPGRLSPPAKSR